jgi:hypothetical protein
MAWSEINLEKQVWTIPRHKTKSDRGHEVQLLAMDVLPQCSVRAADCLGWQRTIESSERSLAFRQTNPPGRNRGLAAARPAPHSDNWHG